MKTCKICGKEYKAMTKMTQFGKGLNKNGKQITYARCCCLEKANRAKKLQEKKNVEETCDIPIIVKDSTKSPYGISE